MMRKLMLSTFICLLTVCWPYFLPQQQAAPDNQDRTVLPGSRIRANSDIVNAEEGVRLKRSLNDLSGAKAQVGNHASPVGGKDWLGNAVDAKVIGGLSPFATGPRGPFTGEGRLLTERRNFAMSSGDRGRNGRPDIVGQSRIEKIDALVKSFEVNEHFSGVVLVAQDGNVLFKKAFGLANREWNVPNTVDTRFPIGSIMSYCRENKR